MNQGQRTPESLLDDPKADALTSATAAYGVGHRYLVHGQRDKAVAVFRRRLRGLNGARRYLAAEADLARLGSPQARPEALATPRPDS